MVRKYFECTQKGRGHNVFLVFGGDGTGYPSAPLFLFCFVFIVSVYFLCHLALNFRPSAEFFCKALRSESHSFVAWWRILKGAAPHFQLVTFVSLKQIVCGKTALFCWWRGRRDALPFDVSSYWDHTCAFKHARHQITQSAVWNTFAFFAVASFTFKLWIIQTRAFFSSITCIHTYIIKEAILKVGIL